MTDPAPDRPEHEPRHLFPRDTVWGDEPSEVDASEAVAETPESTTESRWHDHWVWVPFKVVWRFIRKSGKRVAVTIAGFVVLLAGVAMLVLPGPGILVVIAGLAILATEYVWAQRLLMKAKKKAEQAKNAVLGKKTSDEDVAPES
jgi:uncharacterized protein (TIGR02611 family)